MAYDLGVALYQLWATLRVVACYFWLLGFPGTSDGFGVPLWCLGGYGEVQGLIELSDMSQAVNFGLMTVTTSS